MGSTIAISSISCSDPGLVTQRSAFSHLLPPATRISCSIPKIICDELPEPCRRRGCIGRQMREKPCGWEARLIFFHHASRRVFRWKTPGWGHGSMFILGHRRRWPAMVDALCDATRYHQHLPAVPRAAGAGAGAAAETQQKEFLRLQPLVEKTRRPTYAGNVSRGGYREPTR